MIVEDRVYEGTTAEIVEMSWRLGQQPVTKPKRERRKRKGKRRHGRPRKRK